MNVDFLQLCSRVGLPRQQRGELGIELLFGLVIAAVLPAAALFWLRRFRLFPVLDRTDDARAASTVCAIHAVEVGQKSRERLICRFITTRSLTTSSRRRRRRPSPVTGTDDCRSVVCSERRSRSVTSHGGVSQHGCELVWVEVVVIDEKIIILVILSTLREPLGPVAPFHASRRREHRAHTREVSLGLLFCPRLSGVICRRVALDVFHCTSLLVSAAFHQATLAELAARQATLIDAPLLDVRLGLCHPRVPRALPLSEGILGDGNALPNLGAFLLQNLLICPLAGLLLLHHRLELGFEDIPRG